MATAKKTRTSPYRSVDAVEVSAWGKRVGAVAREPTKNYYAFQYDPAWVKTGIELAPITMPLAQASEPFIFTDLPEPTYKRLPALLADALPDDFGNALIDAWMADQGITKTAITSLDRLAYMGKRGMGALTFRPLRGPSPSKPTAIHLGQLVEAARLAVMGQFDIPEGFEAWLLKFDGMGRDNALGPSKGYGRIEYAYHLMAAEAGIDMSPCRLLEENGRAHFMTRRFDREGNQRHHLQTLCAMAHLDYKQVATHSYNQLFQTANQLQLGRGALVEILRRMVFNVLAVNNDDHTKNFSFLLREGASWALAPAYDITHAFNPDNEWVKQHLMSVNGRFHQITRLDVREVADRFGLLSDVTDVIDKVQQAVGQWQGFAKRAGVDNAEAEAIASQIAERAF